MPIGENYYILCNIITVQQRLRCNIYTLAFRFYRFSGSALTAGVEHHVVDGVPVRVYGVTTTVADCFKIRNKVGLDVALEALREV